MAEERQVVVFVMTLALCLHNTPTHLPPHTHTLAHLQSEGDTEDPISNGENGFHAFHKRSNSCSSADKLKKVQTQSQPQPQARTQPQTQAQAQPQPQPQTRFRLRLNLSLKSVLNLPANPHSPVSLLPQNKRWLCFERSHTHTLPRQTKRHQLLC